MDFFKQALDLIGNTADEIINSYNINRQYREQSGEGFISTFTDKGANGEYNIYRKIAKLSEEKLCIANCYIPKQDGSTSEIDVILIHKTGLYVFESKNYKGYIFGSESQQNWTVTLRGSGGRVDKYQFFNPILQNKGHISWLKKYLTFDVPIYSYIVFGNNCEFKSLTYDNSIVKVCHNRDLSSVLEMDLSNRNSTVDDVTQRTIYSKLNALSHRSTGEKQNHIYQAKNAINNYKNNEADTNRKCPKCGSRLVLRTAKSGSHAGNKFYGCSGYPQCRYIENIP